MAGSKDADLKVVQKQEDAKRGSGEILAETDELRFIGELYRQLDNDGDGSLTFEEIKEGLKRLERDDTDFIYQLLAQADTDGSGEIDFEEFVAAIQG